MCRNQVIHGCMHAAVAQSLPSKIGRLETWHSRTRLGSNGSWGWTGHTCAGLGITDGIMQGEAGQGSAEQRARGLLIRAGQGRAAGWGDLDQSSPG